MLQTVQLEPFENFDFSFAVPLAIWILNGTGYGERRLILQLFWKHSDNKFSYYPIDRIYCHTMVN